MSKEINLSVIEQKNKIRNNMKIELKKIHTKLDRETRSMLATEQFIRSDLYKEAACLFMFISKKTEIETRYVMQRAFLDKKDVVIPRMFGDSIEFYYLQPGVELTLQVEEGPFGILEPLLSLPRIDACSLPVNSVFLLPGLAFAESGTRVGYGKGYYDRYIDTVYRENSSLHLPKALVGFAYSCQVFPDLPSEEHDIPLTHIVTEKEIITC